MRKITRGVAQIFTNNRKLIRRFAEGLSIGMMPCYFSCTHGGLMLYPEFSVLGRISREIKLLELHRDKSRHEEVRQVSAALEVLCECLEKTAAKYEGQVAR